MIVVTGAAGFIGSALVWRLNQAGIEEILAVDTAGKEGTAPPLLGLRVTELVDRERFLEAVRGDRLPRSIRAVVHLGACAETTERDEQFLRKNNTEYTRHLAEWTVRNGARFLYASSAATYGDGSQGFSDADEATLRLRPLNPYGASKHAFDLHVLRSDLRGRIAGFKFFNVFGPNEYHKGPMVSGAYRMAQQIRETGRIALFRSEHPDYGDGEQRRDFVYVKDCVELLWWFLQRPEVNGLFNVGTGQDRSWNDLARAIFAALERPEAIDYVPLPEALRGSYQYYTAADLTRLRAAGYDRPFTPLEDAVADYVRGYLTQPNPYLQA